MVVAPRGQILFVLLARAMEAVDHDLHHRRLAHPRRPLARGVVHSDLVARRLVAVDLARAVAVVARVAVIQRRDGVRAQILVRQRGSVHRGAQRVAIVVFEDEVIPQTAGILRQRGLAGKHVLARPRGDGVRPLHMPGAVLGKERGIGGHARHGHAPFAPVLPQSQGRGFCAIRPHRETHRFTQRTRAFGKAKARVAGIVKDHSSKGSRCQIFSLYSAMVRSAAKMPLLAVLVTAIFSHLSRSR